MKNIGKEVFLMADGKKFGYVLDVAIDFQSFVKTGYIVVDEESETEFYLDDANIRKVGDFILVQDESALRYLEEKHESLIGKKVFDVVGQDLGMIENVLFERQKCKRLVTERCEIETRFVKNVGRDVIFISFHKERKKKFGMKEKDFKDVTVRIQNDEKIISPEKISLAFNFYSGKVAKEDVLGYNNERIVTKGDVISRAVFENVKKHNKLNELFFAIK